MGLGESDGMAAHVRALRRLRAEGGDRVAGMFGTEPPVGYWVGEGAGAEPDAAGVDVEVVDSLVQATQLLYPGNTVVHLCTPPGDRTVMHELVDRGFRLVLLDAPLAVDRDGLRRLVGLAERYRLRIGVVDPWLNGGICRRLLAAVSDGRLGAVRRISVRHSVPRLAQTFSAEQPGTALDVEPPHSIALALALAGMAEVAAATVEDTPTVDGRRVADMGGARLTLRHQAGATTDIFCDLAAPMAEQQVIVEFDKGSVQCNYPLGTEAGFAQMYWTTENGQTRRDIFADDPLRQGFLDAYRLFVTESWPQPSLRLHARVVELLADAKALARRSAPTPGSIPPVQHPTPISVQQPTPVPIAAQQPVPVPFQQPVPAPVAYQQPAPATAAFQQQAPAEIFHQQAPAAMPVQHTTAMAVQHSAPTPVHSPQRRMDPPTPQPFPAAQPHMPQPGSAAMAAAPPPATRQIPQTARQMVDYARRPA
ncbi:MAG: hypothetical protein HOQ24_19745 [Mycobacteriaceae bacterium]|nr:hypothetical protein [Mycobacteriaceae bacterium]